MRLFAPKSGIFWSWIENRTLNKKIKKNYFLDPKLKLLLYLNCCISKFAIDLKTHLKICYILQFCASIKDKFVDCGNNNKSR